MPNNTRLKYKLNTVQNFQHAIKIGAFTKQMLKKIFRMRIKFFFKKN